MTDLASDTDDAQSDSDLAKLANDPKLDRLLAKLGDSRDLDRLLAELTRQQLRVLSDPNLVRLVDHWESLPTATKQNIVQMVDKAGHG